MMVRAYHFHLSSRSVCQARSTIRGRKKENRRILLAFRRFQLRSRRKGAAFSPDLFISHASLLFGASHYHALWQGGHLSLSIYLRAETLWEQCNQPKVVIRSWIALNFLRRFRSKDTRDTERVVALGVHVILVIPREGERYILGNGNIPSLDISACVLFSNSGRCIYSIKSRR